VVIKLKIVALSVRNTMRCSLPRRNQSKAAVSWVVGQFEISLSSDLSWLYTNKVQDIKGQAGNTRQHSAKTFWDPWRGYYPLILHQASSGEREDQRHNH
jgi:hypothetical protein